MNPLVRAIFDADRWSDYQRAYRRAYECLLQEMWALGKADYAETLHHTVVPDVTGQVFNTNWAVYSQPSAATFDVVAAALRNNLLQLPSEYRTHRYVFVVPTEPAFSRDRILGDGGAYLDAHSDVLDRCLNMSASGAALYSTEVLLASGSPVLPRLDLAADVDAATLERAARTVAAGRVSEDSVVPRAFRKALAESSVILAAVRMGLRPAEIALLPLSGIALASRVASNRAKASAWNAEPIERCEAVAKALPLETIEHVVRPGETLTRLVRRLLGIPLNAIWPLVQEINPKLTDPNVIRMGQTLRLPVMYKRDDE